MNRILIISNECLSQTSSNGRTLLNLLNGYHSSALAQSYIHGTPDLTACENYFRISDNKALRAFLHKKAQIESKAIDTQKHNKPQRNCRNMVLRDIVWMSYKWWDKAFDDFINDFDPEVVLLQAGDSPFMYAIARKISRLRNIPLVMYNSESYVLKKRIYNSAKLYSLWHFILQRRLKRQYKLLMKDCSYCVYSMEHLEKAYQAAYPHPEKSATLYISYSTLNEAKTTRDQPFTLAYCGNLGVGRSDCIKEIADVLYRLDKNSKMIICGKFPSVKDQEAVCTNPVVDYRGIVAYEEVQNIIKNASMVIHCEKEDRLENLRYAFSTKIADLLASGKPFIVYASHEYPFVEYLERNKAAHIAGNQNELEAILSECMTDKTFMNSKIENALLLAESNHNISKNAQAFHNIINAVVIAKVCS